MEHTLEGALSSYNVLLLPLTEAITLDFANFLYETFGYCIPVTQGKYMVRVTMEGCENW